MSPESCNPGRRRCPPGKAPPAAGRSPAPGFTLAELLIVIAMIGTVALVVVPLLLRARLASNEASAIASLNAVVSGEVAYSSTCGHNGYATAFATLGIPVPGSQDPFLPPDLTSDVRPQMRGYAYTLAAGAGATRGVRDCNETETWTGYYATAVPIRPGVTGSRAFAASSKGAVWQDTAQGGAAAPAEPFAVTASITPIE